MAEGSVFDFGNSESFGAASAPNPGNNEASSAAAAAIAGAEASKRKRGRPSKTSAPDGSLGASKSTSATVPPDLQAEIAKQLEHCYDPKAWSALLSMPADTALAITGRKHWDLSTRERDTLGATGSTAARFLILSNPKTLALLMLGSALFAAYVPRIKEEFSTRKKEKTASDEKSTGGSA